MSTIRYYVSTIALAVDRMKVLRPILTQSEYASAKHDCMQHVLMESVLCNVFEKNYEHDKMLCLYIALAVDRMKVLGLIYPEYASAKHDHYIKHVLRESVLCTSK